MTPCPFCRMRCWRILSGLRVEMCRHDKRASGNGSGVTTTSPAQHATHTDAVYAGSQLPLLNPDLILQQHQQVIHQVRCLVGQKLKAVMPLLPVPVSTLRHTSAQCVWSRWHTVWRCRRFPGRQIYVRRAVVPADTGTATGERCRRKQLLVPLWQVGPMGFASTSNVSLSQSGAMLTTLRKLPEVSPLVHSRCLVREKKVTLPLSDGSV